MLSPIVRVNTLAFASCLAWGQTFEAASVKPAALPVPNGRGRIAIAMPSGGPGTKDPGRIRYPFVSLRDLLVRAYDVKAYQITGPAWLDTERYEVNATMAPETTMEQFRAMLQNLLAERFKLTMHRETKDLPMYSLIVAKNGPKMKETGDAPPLKEGDGDAPPPPLPSQPKIGPDGFPVLPPPSGGRGGMMMLMMPGRARLSGEHQTIQDLASRLTSQLGRPVTDATGLKGKYDITLTYSSEGMNGLLGPVGPGPAMVAVPPPGGAPPGGGGAGGAAGVFVPEGEAPPDIFAAVQQQLGLKLESKKGPVEMIVVDHVEKTPTEN
uniref:Soil-associated protein, TIGR03435 family n=1 Tax=Solibacter usitatus (strain Ellin6076) TaxID=234267 RepID=Q01ZL5_SOLUE